MTTYTTNLTQKSMNRYNIARYLGLGSPNCYEYVGQFVNFMLTDARIKKHVKEKLGDKYEETIKKATKFTALYNYIGILEKQLRDEKINKKTKTEIIEKKLQKICTITPIVNYEMIQLYALVIECTDLKNNPVPSEEIMSPERGKLKITDQKKFDGRKGTLKSPFEM